MKHLRIVNDIEEGRQIWENEIPRENISDLWQFRQCFHKHYGRKPAFVTVYDNSRISGFLPLSIIPKDGAYVYFPGEIWDNKTWVEQNRIIIKNEQAHNLIKFWLNSQDSGYHLRYLLPAGDKDGLKRSVDEIGYLFYPGEVNFDYEQYLNGFSHKFIKNLKGELRKLEAYGLTYRFDDLSDFELMVDMNVRRYGSYSYFSDPRFRNSFYDVLCYLAGQGWLRMTTVLLGGRPAAVDLGCVYNDTYTLLAGGTEADFPGVAKLINLYHIRRSCEERFQRVDFLCGDFSWKTRFHLSPRPLYRVADAITEKALKPEIIPFDHTQPEVNNVLSGRL